MNFLELCQRTRQELGVSGTGPASTSRQVGHYKKIVDWVQDAHLEVQESLALNGYAMAWATVPLTDGVDTYDPDAQWGLQVKRLAPDSLCVQPVGNPARRTHLVEASWDWMRARVASPTGTPSAYAARPDGKIVLWPTPGDQLELHIEYERKSLPLASNTDVPWLPTEYHMAIVWRAVMFGTAHDEDLALFQSAKSNHAAIMSRVARQQLPTMEVSTLL